jgi:uncharacterized protein (TIGR00255 family)
MIRSMTGYGSAASEGDTFRATVTVRTLNHRFLELHVHLPRRLQPLEREVKDLVQERLRRGRVELGVQASFGASATGDTVVPARPLVASLVEALRGLRGELGLEGDVTVSDVARFPGALEPVEAPPEVSPEARDRVLALVGRALDGAGQMRGAEGVRVEAELQRSLRAVEGAADRIERLSEASYETRRQLLAERVARLCGEMGLEETRLYQEVVRAVERHDVAEELQRLRSHAGAARDLLGADDAVGKRLDFLAQELAREANTIGSKAADTEVVHEVVKLKAEIEKLREQVQNVE